MCKVGGREYAQQHVKLLYLSFASSDYGKQRQKKTCALSTADLCVIICSY